MSGTAKRRHQKQRQQFYRTAATRTDRSGRKAKRFYDHQIERAERELKAHNAAQRWSGCRFTDDGVCAAVQGPASGACICSNPGYRNAVASGELVQWARERASDPLASQPVRPQAER